jgi:predicted ArsR family transcriptional regulator
MDTQTTNDTTATAVQTETNTVTSVTGTIKELAAKFGMDAVTTRGALTFLATRGHVKTVGKQVVEKMRGKPAVIYQVNTKIVLDLNTKS